MNLWYDVNTGSIIEDNIASNLYRAKKRVLDQNRRLLGRSKQDIVDFLRDFKHDYEQRFYTAARALEQNEISYKMTCVPQYDTEASCQIPSQEQWFKLKQVVISITDDLRVLKYRYKSQKNTIELKIAVSDVGVNHTQLISRIKAIFRRRYRFDPGTLVLQLRKITIGIGEKSYDALCEIPTLKHSFHQLSHKDEDRYLHLVQEDVAITAVFDGHGGNQTVNYLVAQTKQWLELAIPFPATVSEMQERATMIFRQIDQQLRKIVTDQSGSTAIIAVQDIVTERTFFINLGDSRAVWQHVVGGKVYATQDHKPDEPSEKQRILDAGGRVERSSGIARVNGILALSRAFGDFDLKSPRQKHSLVSCKPKVYGTDGNQPLVMNRHSMYILASDGVWDVLSNQEVLAIARATDNSSGVCEKITREAYNRGSRDDITANMIHVR
jgi:protein phosphatase 1L